MYFRILGQIQAKRRIAKGTGIDSLARLRVKYGGSNWRKMSGEVDVELPNGVIRKAEVHWYEATGIGPKEYKVKKFLD